MKTISFGWLIIGKLLITPKRSTSNHNCFVCQLQIQFLCWHRACTVLLAASDTQHLTAAASYPTPTPHVAPPGLPNGNTWSSSQLLTLTPNHALCNQHSLQPWNVKMICSSWGFAVPFQKVFLKMELPLLQLCRFKQRCDLHVLKGTAVTAEKAPG